MSLLDDVSIVVTPNGYKAGELYAVVPVPSEGAELLTNGDFASDLTGWTGYGTTSATGGVATIGASANSGIYQDILTEGVRYTVTVNVTSYDGVGTAEFVNGNGNNLYTITETGIQTFTFTHNIAASSLILRGMSNALFSVSSVSVKEVTRDNVPRIDYTGGGCPHILAEPQRTNLITYSEDFTQWTKVNYTVQSNVGISPSGNNDASSLTNPSGGGGNIKQNTTVTASTNYTFSFYAKRGTASDVKYSVYDNTNGGDIIASTSYYSQLNSSTFTRVTVSFATPVGCTSIGVYILRDNGTAGTVIVWGAQLEAGSYATSYIPTSGSSVTRNQDVFTRDGISSLINDSEGVLFVEMAALANDGTFRGISISDGTNNNRIALLFSNNANIIRVQVVSNNSLDVLIDKSITTTQSNKFAFSYNQNDFKFWINGVEVGTDTSGNTPIGLNSLQFNSGSGGSPFYGKVKQLQVYNTALTDAQLTSLTT